MDNATDLTMTVSSIKSHIIEAKMKEIKMAFGAACCSESSKPLMHLDHTVILTLCPFSRQLMSVHLETL